MKNAKQIDFNRDRSENKRAVRRVLTALCAVLALGVVVFVGVLALNDFDFDKFLGTAEAPTGDESTTEPVTQGNYADPFTDENAINILFLCSEGKTVTFCEILSFSAAENSIRVKPVSPELKLTFGEQNLRVAEIFYQYGAAEVADALGQKNVTIHRWLGVSESAFRKIVQEFGNIDVYLPGNVDFSVDAIRYQFPRGTRSLTSDALLRVMKYGYEGDDALSFQASAMAAVLRAVLTEQTMEKGEAYFTEFVNQVDGNITAFDYAGYRQRLTELIRRSPEIAVIS